MTQPKRFNIKSAVLQALPFRVDRMKDENNTDANADKFTTTLVPNETMQVLGDLFCTLGVVDHVSIPCLVKALGRHLRGDWGDVCKEDWDANDRALKHGMRMLSVYYSNGTQPTNGGADSEPVKTKFWIITEADRSSTTVLLPNEY